LVLTRLPIAQQLGERAHEWHRVGTSIKPVIYSFPAPDAVQESEDFVC